MDDLTGLVLAAGALGTAAFGIVEAAKWTWLGEAGFGTVKRMLGPLSAALAVAYGGRYEELLRAQYRRDRQPGGEIAKTLRQGVRVGLNAGNAPELAAFVGTVAPEALAGVAKSFARGADLSGEERGILGRFELAVDARIDAALTLACDRYLGAVRVTASLVAIALSFLGAAAIGANPAYALVVGVAAVPLAPIANDVVGALQAATKALKSTR